MSEPDMSEQGRAERVAAALGRHGYAFQNAVIRRAEELHTAGKSKWVFEAAEFPIEVRGKDSRIDFVLWIHQSPLWMIAECKRVYPDHAEWVFFRTPYVRRNHTEQYIAEKIAMVDELVIGAPVALGGLPFAPDVMHGLEVPIIKRDDKNIGTPQPIEDAIGQVLRGVNGMVEHLKCHAATVKKSKVRILLPVVFTTARLYVHQEPLTHGNVDRGSVDASELQLQECPYVHYHYHMSPGLRHSAIAAQVASDDVYDTGLRDSLLQESIRSVTIVNSKSIEKFLGRFEQTSVSIQSTI